MFPNAIETDLTDYQGSLEATAFELAPAFNPSHVIRSDQDWGVQVEWEVNGPLTQWLDAQFRISVFLERIGTGSDIDLPIVNVHTLSEPYDPTAQSRTYKRDVNVNAGDIAPGVYKIVTCLQLFEQATGNPTPIAGLAEGRMVHIFDPA